MDNNELAKSLISQLSGLLDQYRLEQEHNFQEIKGQISDLQNHVLAIEKNLQNKIMRDEKRYGHIQYKLFEQKAN